MFDSHLQIKATITPFKKQNDNETKIFLVHLQIKQATVMSRRVVTKIFRRTEMNRTEGEGLALVDFEQSREKKTHPTTIIASNIV